MSPAASLLADQPGWWSRDEQAEAIVTSAGSAPRQHAARPRDGMSEAADDPDLDAVGLGLDAEPAGVWLTSVAASVVKLPPPRRAS
jgi:hypothetical protein